MVKIGVLKLEGYREWTESVGFDREWIIQTIQANMYKWLQERISRINGFVIPLRYDYMVLILEGVDNNDVLDVIENFSSLSPVPIRLSIGCGKTPYEAQVVATKRLVENNCMICIEECKPTGIVAAHFDVNGFSSLVNKLSVYDTYIEVEKLCIDLSRRVQKLGGISQYLGGDNILAFVSVNVIEDIKEIVNSIPGLKVGIGASNSTRKALENAARALDIIRRNRDKENINYIVIQDNE